ncbi:histidinol-phosphate transaminase [Mahella sp.]|uniref:histidinol-phosphate transaminase n=1 Tax=Mahella sp. TaxID=2798721 RepID=UPI0025BBC898|nr:histidinol-phosphate transaminase [Mahella sp.]MBZ4666201.1 histidinol phosphate aminotransferase apoenzyme [Mahella sp.]
MIVLKPREVIPKMKPYIPGKPIGDVKRELGLQNVIKLASNENPLGCSPLAKKAISDMMGELAIYPDGNCTELRQAMAQKLDVKPEQLIFGNGSDEIVEMISHVYIEPGDQALIGNVTFSEYQASVELMGGQCTEVPLKDHTFDLDAFYSAITDKTKVIWLCNPNNPTGTIYSGVKQLEFIDAVPKNILVVIDEAYNEYTDDPSYPESINLVDRYDNIIVLRTFSKIYGLASLRLGYGIANPAIIDLLNRIRAPFNVNSVAQSAALAALEDRDFLSKSKQNNDQGKKYLYAAFDKMGLEYIPTQANFIMVNVDRDSRQVFRDLLTHGIIVRSGEIFKMDNWIRVTIGTPEQNEAFISALKEVL